MLLQFLGNVQNLKVCLSNICPYVACFFFAKNPILGILMTKILTYLAKQLIFGTKNLFGENI